MLTPRDTACYRQWILANAWAEAAGLGTTFVLGLLAVPVLDQVAGALEIVLAALLAVLLGTLLEGVLVGAAQERVLRGRLPRLRPRAWTVATALGAGLAWLLGMVPSTVMALLASETPGPAGAEPGAAAQYALAGALGLLVGPVLGLAQWRVLRGVVERPARWLWANALAWAVGMPLIFFGMDHVPWAGPPLVAVAAIYLVCGLSGAVVGAIHGRVLVRLLASPVPAPAAA